MDQHPRSTKRHSRPATKGYASRPIINSLNSRNQQNQKNNNADIRLRVKPSTNVNSPQSSKTIKSAEKKSRIVNEKHNLAKLSGHKQKQYSDFPVPRKKKLSLRYTQKNQKALFFPVILILIFSMSSILAWQAGKVKSHNLAQEIVPEAQYETDIGSGVAVYDTDPVSEKIRQKYIVEPDLPRFLQIQKINLNSRIQKVNIDSSGNINMPKNIYDIGWYEGSSKPGDRGVSFLNGQANYKGGPAVFANLDKLVKGDEITIEMGSGNFISYRVVSTTSLPAEKIKLISLLDPVEIKGQGLTLMTLSGQYDQKTKTYPNRTVVLAEKI